MTSITQSIRRFINDEEGVTAIEYGLLAALIACALIAGATLLGTNLNALFDGIATVIGPLIP